MKQSALFKISEPQHENIKQIGYPTEQQNLLLQRAFRSCLIYDEIPEQQPLFQRRFRHRPEC